MKKHLIVASALLVAAACASAPRRLPDDSVEVEVPVPPPARPLEELQAQLRAPDAPSRAAAAWGLAGAGTIDASMLQALRSALDDPSAPVREAATWALAHVAAADWKATELYSEPPKLVASIPPHYPVEAFRRRIQGVVMVEILIDESGRVSQAAVRRSVPFLDDAALTAVRGWQFTPARLKGKPVPCVANAPVSFRIGK